MTSTHTTTSTAQLHPLGGQYVSRIDTGAGVGVGSYTGSSAHDATMIGSYVTTVAERNLAVGRYTRSERRGVSAWTTAVRTLTGSIVTYRTAA
ncbi:hypothetical protein [Frigoribacterium sp. CFBP 13712]|uniref:hypothetical protein n=1 Tax=Frigoribacterium sp. CFBP 13712 TaxID=2775309 RepID=UPI001781AEBC|nr:hypothetical protein [Frigoribacterium sp. CFBP 13712]MBD8704038.1 hypothetical protein [Frigoribacterium sp. CFBP 13712]